MSVETVKQCFHFPRLVALTLQYIRTQSDQLFTKNWEKWLIQAIPESIIAKWKAKNLVQDLNLNRRNKLHLFLPCKEFKPCQTYSKILVLYSNSPGDCRVYTTSFCYLHVLVKYILATFHKIYIYPLSIKVFQRFMADQTEIWLWTDNIPCLLNWNQWLIGVISTNVLLQTGCNTMKMRSAWSQRL